MGPDYILQIVEQFMKLIRALLKKKNGEESHQQVDALLSELTGFNAEILYKVDLSLLAGLLRVVKDDNRKAMVCILLKERDEKRFGRLIDELSWEIEVNQLEPTVRILFEEKFRPVDFNQSQSRGTG